MKKKLIEPHGSLWEFVPQKVNALRKDVENGLLKGKRHVIYMVENLKALKRLKERLNHAWQYYGMAATLGRR